MHIRHALLLWEWSKEVSRKGNVGKDVGDDNRAVALRNDEPPEKYRSMLYSKPSHSGYVNR